MAQSNVNGYNGNQDILYKDDAGVVITPVSLKVKNRLYPVEDIDRFAISKSQANRVSGIIMTVAGAGIAVASYFPVASAYINTYIPPVDIQNISLSSVELVQITGATLTTIGLLMILLKQSFFALSVVMGSETMEVAIHRKKRYISRIAKALEIAVRRRDRKFQQEQHPATSSTDVDYFRESTKTFG